MFRKQPRRRWYDRATARPTNVRTATPLIPTSAAAAGRRRAHFTARSHDPDRRARIGSPAQVPLQVVGQRRRRAYRRRGSFSRHFRQIVSRSRSTRRLSRDGRLRRPLPHLLQRLQHRVAPERRPAGQQRVEDRPQAVDVGRRRDRPPAGPTACSGAMYCGVPTTAPESVSSPSPSIRLASPKSVTCGRPSRVEQDVRRLEVAVQDAPLVGVVDRPGDRRHQPGRGPRVGRVVGQPARPGCRPRPASC